DLNPSAGHFGGYLALSPLRRGLFPHRALRTSSRPKRPDRRWRNSRHTQRNQAPYRRDQIRADRLRSSAASSALPRWRTRPRVSTPPSLPSPLHARRSPSESRTHRGNTRRSARPTDGRDHRRAFRGSETPTRSLASALRGPHLSNFETLREFRCVGNLNGRSFRLRLNGLTAHHVHDPTATVIAFQTWYRCGSRDEEEGKTGVAHLLEHLMFGATRDYPIGEFDRKMEEAGAETNAATSTDFTYYYESLPRDA